jgi:hypothetical protein
MIYTVRQPTSSSIRGRAGVVHIKSDFCVDVVLIITYVPPACTKNSESTSRALFQLVEQQLALLSKRCSVVHLCDANVRLGTPLPAYVFGSQHGLEQRVSSVGLCFPEQKNVNSSIFRDFLSRSGLVAISTFYEAGLTYWSNVGTVTRVDYVFCSQALVPLVKECYTDIEI